MERRRGEYDAVFVELVDYDDATKSQSTPRLVQLRRRSIHTVSKHGQFGHSVQYQ
jgi:hypothetical protein